MGKPCEPMHPAAVEGCPICWRAVNSRAHQRVWGLPETGTHADATGPARLGAVAPTPQAHALPPCTLLGAKLPGEPCGSTLRLCTLHGDACTRFVPCKGAARCCANCPDHAPEAP